MARRTTRAGASDAAEPAASASGMAQALSGGRISYDTEATYLGVPANVILPPSEPDAVWRTAHLDARTLDRLSPAQLLERLADLSPEVSRALWDFLRFCNPGWEATALRPGTEEADEAAQLILDGFLGTLHDLYGSIDVVIGRLFMAAFLRGALMAELVLSPDGRLPVDLATPDPHSVRFRRALDPVRGPVWQLGQWQLGGFVVLDRLTIRYIPVDPFPGSPYGRALAAPATFTALFLLGLLHDLRRVVAQQGYPRLDITLDLLRLKETMPVDAAADPAQFLAWAQALQREVETAYAQLQPDDVYIHSDVVKVGSPVGTMGAQALGVISDLIAALERMSTRALKSNPLLMVMSEGLSESTANRMWEVASAGIKSVQHLAEVLLERLMGLALRAQGIQASVRWRFAELRASEMLRDQQTLALTISNARQAYNAGFVSMDEAAQMAVGHPADARYPRILERAETESVSEQTLEAADPGANRLAPLVVRGGEMTTREPANGHEQDADVLTEPQDRPGANGAQRDPGDEWMSDLHGGEVVLAPGDPRRRHGQDRRPRRPH